MAKSIRVSTKRRGRPKTTGKGELIGVRILPPLLKKLDAWISGQIPRPSRPEKASELAARAAEHLVDKSLPPEEQQRRKRALVKGPKEFRDIREDLPKSKS